MTGRQLPRRPDIEKELAACAEDGVAVEINANLLRLDLDRRWHETALNLACLMSISPDAHSTRELDLAHWGVEMARKGGVPKNKVLNGLSNDELARYLEKRRARRRSEPVPLQRRSLCPRTSATGIEKRTASRKIRKAAIRQFVRAASLATPEPNIPQPVSPHSIRSNG